MKRIFFMSWLFICSITSIGQKIIHGTVTDAEKNNPIPYASIFLSNTSIGTKSDDKGNFEITIPNGRYDLVVSSVGYETFSQAINNNNLPDFLEVKMKVKAESMETIIIQPFEKDGWEKWGRFFLDNFIGTSGNSTNCEILNTDVIRFREDKKTKEISAYAMEPLIIENKALGYRVHYQLENFNYSFQTHYLLYTGYPFFEPMDGGISKQKRWERRRKEAYEGSMMHFMRSVYRNSIASEGFEVRSLVKQRNTEKQRVKEIYARNVLSQRSNGKTVISNEIDKSDSADYYRKVISQQDYFDIIGNELLPGDSIAYAMNTTTAGLAFNNYLLVIYKNKIAPIEYRQQFPGNSTAMMSQIVLINKIPVEVQANGSYYNPADLMSLGYWAWSEKIAMLLPYDYEPSK
jgi:hypothetical protein